MTATEQLYARRQTRKDPNLWARHCGFEPAAHHRLINEALERASSAGNQFIALFLPPGSAKSTYGSVLYPPLFLAGGRNRCILACSHSQTLAESFGRRSRNLVIENPLVLGYGLRADSKAAGEWETTNGGRYFCAGVGTKIAGHRADLAIIDDPVGSKEDAESDLLRQKVWDWFNFDFLTRLKPGASVVLIMTRWHEDDLGGRILDPKVNTNFDTQKWNVIKVPLIAVANDPLGREPGEPLWKEYFTENQIESAKRSPAFTQLYQQEPTPEDGDFFKVEWLRTYDSPEKLPSGLRYYAASDHAISEENQADETVLLPVGMDEDDDIWVLPDVWWKRETSDIVVDEMFRLCRTFRFDFWWAGKDHITGSVGPFISKRESEERVFIPLEELPSMNKKLAQRAQSIRGFMKMGRVRFPSFAPWWQKARAQMLGFPNAKHDDFVAALTELGRGLSKMGGVKPVAKDPTEGKVDAPPITFGDIRQWQRDADFRAEVATLDL